MEDIKTQTLSTIIAKYPFATGFFENSSIPEPQNLDQTCYAYIESLDEDIRETLALEAGEVAQRFTDYIEAMKGLFSDDSDKKYDITILPGFHKDGRPENFESIQIKSGEVLSIVGPTGSGKSRLLADIEWAANKDTPTQRTVLINGKTLEMDERFSVGNKLVAQLSQNMNFVMDLSVKEFLDLHASSRMIEGKESLINEIFEKANELAGEPFALETPITGLSGGQSRALMIADTAMLSKAPIILIDEIENAGIDRKKALDLLVNENKIVLMSTHDPILALMGDKRIVINKGGIADMIETTDEERSILGNLQKLDNIMLEMRQKLRYGKKLDLGDIEYA